MARAAGFFRSAHSVRSLVALSQAGRTGLSLRELARCLRLADSSAQAALRVLREAGALQREATRYRLGRGPVQQELLVVALDHLPREEALEILVCANPAVEYASIVSARDGLELIAILRNVRDHLAAAQLDRAVRSFRRGPSVRLTMETHDDLVHELRDRSSQVQDIRRRALRGRRLKGTEARSLPDRMRRRPSGARVRMLHRPSPRLRLPAARVLRQLAERFGLERISLFGSAVRSDFRPDSDVDVLVRYRPERRRDLFAEIELEDVLEDLFDRDVDLVVEGALHERLRPRVERETVALHG